MEEIQVRMVTLEPLHVVAAHAYSASPEVEAWKKLVDWAKPKGLLDPAGAPRIFGFNNPDPSPGSPNYGYEFWLTVDPQVSSEGEFERKEFAGGLYAVTRCQGIPNIGPTWKRLVAWRENSPYRMACHQWLEEHIGALIPGQLGDDLTLDLYMPVIG